ncbi:RDD family protein [Lysobacter fragariae]
MSNGAVLDTYREVVTPEGVALHLPAAGPVPRALAWLIDFAIRAGVMFVAGIVLGVLGTSGAGPYAVTLFIVFWFYPVLFEALDNGRTPGKRALGLRVIAANGAPVGWLAAFTRNLIRVVDLLPFGYATGLVASLADPWGRRLGDMVAGTLVVHATVEQESRSAVENVALAPSVPLLPHEQVALVAYAERAPQLTRERQEELADLAEPLVHARGAVAVQRLYGIANWLLGRR